MSAALLASQLPKNPQAAPSTVPTAVPIGPPIQVPIAAPAFAPRAVPAAQPPTSAVVFIAVLPNCLNPSVAPIWNAGITSKTTPTPKEKIAKPAFPLIPFIKGANFGCLAAVEVKNLDTFVIPKAFLVFPKNPLLA
ncbi:unknown [Clostridium sp. CAG:813]|nr:unknown [Clostridium sp. CAG:813]